MVRESVILIKCTSEVSDVTIFDFESCFEPQRSNIGSVVSIIFYWNFWHSSSVLRAHEFIIVYRNQTMLNQSILLLVSLLICKACNAFSPQGTAAAPLDKKKVGKAGCSIS